MRRSSRCFGSQWRPIAAMRGLSRLPLALLCAAMVACAPGETWTPIAAHVAVEDLRTEEGVARIGAPIRTDQPSSVRLHAVLEARNEEGAVRWFTEADALEVEGEAVAAETVARWNGPRFAQILWLTLEPEPYFVEIDDAGQLDSVARYQPYSRPEWGRGWIAESVFDLQRDVTFELPVERKVNFGTRFVQVWVQLSTERETSLPEERFESPGSGALREQTGGVATIHLLSEDPSLAAAQGAFGRQQLEPTLLTDELVAGLRTLNQSGLTFQRLGLLRDVIAGTGLAFDVLPWAEVELSTGVSWRSENSEGSEVSEALTGSGPARGVGGGDLLRSGDRWVVLLEDADLDGELEGSDFCLDFDQGPAVQRISDVFVGDGVLEWAPLLEPGNTP